MPDQTFAVQGSAAEPYAVRFRWEETGAFVATCTCAAAAQGSACKHRVGIVLRERSVVANLDSADVDRVVDAAAATTHIHQRLAELAAAELSLAQAKALLAAARRRLSESLLGK